MAEASFRVGLRRSSLQGLRIVAVCALVMCFLGNLQGQASSQDQRPLGRVELMARLALPGPTDELQKLIEQRGLAFQPTETDVSSFKSAGADDALMSAIQKASAGEAGATSPTPQTAIETAVFQHLASGAEFGRKLDSQHAADEFRAALKDDPNNALIHLDLAMVLTRVEGEDASIAELREATRLEPTLAEAHLELGFTLRFRGDLRGAIAQYREALQADTHYEAARLQLGPTLEAARDLQSAISVYQEGTRLEPENWVYHFLLGGALEKSGDQGDAIKEEREAARLKPDKSAPHFMLARIMRETGEVQNAEQEMQLAREIQAKRGGLYRIRIGGQVMVAKLISKIQPEYPKKAKNKRVEGLVRIQAVIGPDGYVQEMKVISGDPLLVKAATDAVQRWVYEPTLLNGEPIEVVTEVDINFSLFR